MVDQNTDINFAALRDLVNAYPGIAEHVKTAQVGEHIRSSLPTHAFADPGNRMFPVHTPADAILSKAYATKVANLAEEVMAQIDTALSLYDVSPNLFEQSKVASNHQEEQPRYLVKSQNKLAFYSDTPIQEGERALRRNQSKLSPSSLTSGALTLVKEARSRGEEVSSWTMKYAGLTQCDNHEASNWLEARAFKATDAKVSDAFSKLAAITSRFDSSLGRDDLIKVANAIGELDKLAGFSRHYGKSMPDPIATIFNTKTAMMPSIDLGGKQVPVTKLLAVSPESFGDILGDDIVEEITEDGELVPDKLTAILDTLPLDMKKTLVKELSL